MPWAETRVVTERMKFVLALEAGETMARACRRFGISRTQGYKWRDRYRERGPSGLEDLPRRPHSCPHALDDTLGERCLAVRREHPHWGPRKVRAYLQDREPGTAWPAASTIGGLFDREGLTVKRRKRRRVPPHEAPFAACGAANDVWCVDFKGWFRTGDGERCDPLTLSDAHSRYLLRCQLVKRLSYEHVWPVLEAALREFGLPRALRSDNGAPFAAVAAGGLSKLAVQVIKAGVVPERIAPGCPHENGRLERLHLTLQEETASPPASTRSSQMVRLHRFQRVYNEERPHEALGQTPPARHYTPSPRSWDGILRSPELDEAVNKRHVRKDGSIKWDGRYVYINENLANEWLSFEECNDGVFLVCYGPIQLGRLQERGHRLVREPAFRRRRNRP